jgi:hypothetical protein
MRSARLGQTSRQHLMEAHELCAREAEARKARPIDPDTRAWSRWLLVFPDAYDGIIISQPNFVTGSCKRG